MTLLPLVFVPQNVQLKMRLKQVEVDKRKLGIKVTALQTAMQQLQAEREATSSSMRQPHMHRPSQGDLIPSGPDDHLAPAVSPDSAFPSLIPFDCSHSPPCSSYTRRHTHAQTLPG